MLLSFSVPEMLPYVRAGIRQAHGEHVTERVKRQTIRAWGPQAERVLAAKTFPYRLSLWWKSRTKEREFLGSIECDGVQACQVEISHDATGRVTVYTYGSVLQMHWHPDRGGKKLTDFAYADGFDSPEAFRAYFVPNIGDVFKGIMFKW